jgi:protein-tyrosine phosphatase
MGRMRDNLKMSILIVFVCTGNICRSPAAERMFRSRADPSAEVQVWSAGTHGVVGSGMEEHCAQALREIGIDPDGHLARQLDVDALADADLVLCATMEQRSIVLQSNPALMRKAFALKEFNRLASDVTNWVGNTDGLHLDSAVGLRARIQLVAGRRGRAAAVAPAQDDIADPLGAGIEQARRCMAEISLGVDAVLDALGLAVVSFSQLPDGGA